MTHYIEKVENNQEKTGTDVDLVYLKDTGMVLAISDEYIGLYDSIEHFWEARPDSPAITPIEHFPPAQGEKLGYFVKAVTPMDTGGGCSIDLVEFNDGRILGIDDDTMCLYQNLQDWQDGYHDRHMSIFIEPPSHGPR